MALRTPLSVTPHLYMGDSTGRPLDKGVVYFGEQDKDPEFYPINLFSDDALTKPLAQPVHTKGGYLYDKGDMVEPHAKELIYSVKVLDSYGRKVFYKGAMMRNSWNDDVIEQINTAIIDSADAARQIATDITNDAINNTAIEGGVLADTFVTVTASGEGQVARSQRDKNSDFANIKDFGGIADYNPTTKTGTPVDDIFNKFISYCSENNKTAIIEGDFYSKGGLKIPSLVKIEANCTIYCDNSSSNVCLEIGSAGHQLRGNKNLSIGGNFGLIKIADDNGRPLWWNNFDDSIGVIAHSLVRASLTGLSVDAFSKNLVLESSGNAGFSGNTFTNPRITNGLNNIIVDIKDNGYVNENKFVAGNITTWSAIPDVKADEIVSINLYTDATYKCNNNQFIGVHLEDRKAKKIFYTNGFNNILSLCRLEGARDESIEFTPTSHSNKISDCLGVSNAGSSVPKGIHYGNNFVGDGQSVQHTYTTVGAFYGYNNTTAEGGGIGRYSVFGAPHKTDIRYLASSVGQKGIGVFQAHPDKGKAPSVWLDSESGQLQLGRGYESPFHSIYASSNDSQIIIGSLKSTQGIGGINIGGFYDKGHLIMRANDKDYHLWIDSAGALRFLGTTKGQLPETQWKGVVVAKDTPVE